MRTRIEDKEILNQEETIRLYKRSNGKFRRFLAEERRSFVLEYSNRKLVIKSEFEEYLGQNPRIWEELKNNDRETKRQ